MAQTRRGSAAEALTNIMVGLTVGFISNLTVLPFFGYNVTLEHSFFISIAFTVISFLRSYGLRRLYNHYNFFGETDDNNEH